MNDREIKSTNRAWLQWSPYQIVTVRMPDGTTKQRLMMDHDIERWNSVDPGHVISIDSNHLDTVEAWRFRIWHAEDMTALRRVNDAMCADRSLCLEDLDYLGYEVDDKSRTLPLID